MCWPEHDSARDGKVWPESRTEGFLGEDYALIWQNLDLNSNATIEPLHFNNEFNFNILSENSKETGIVQGLVAIKEWFICI